MFWQVLVLKNIVEISKKSSMEVSSLDNLEIRIYPYLVTIYREKSLDIPHFSVPRIFREMEGLQISATVKNV